MVGDAEWVEAELPAFLGELRRVLKPTGCGVLLMPGYQRVARLLATKGKGSEEDGEPGYTALGGLILREKRRVAVGGFSCWALTVCIE